MTTAQLLAKIIAGFVERGIDPKKAPIADCFEVLAQYPDQMNWLLDQFARKLK